VLLEQRRHRPLLHLHHALLVSNGASAVAIPRRPALSPWCRLVRDGDRYLVELGGTVVTFEGRAAGVFLPRLLPLLDGTRTIDELIDELGTPVAPAIEHAVSLLNENRLLVDGPHDTDAANGTVAAAAAYAVAVTAVTSEEAAARALSAAQVTIMGSGHGTAPLADQLGAMGIGRVERVGFGTEPAPSALVVAMPASDELPCLSDLNAFGLRSGSPWMQVLPFDGRLVVAGPLFLPGSSACHACYVLRRGACSGFEDDFDLVRGLPSTATTPAPLLSLVTGLAAIMALRWITASDPILPGRFYALESRSILRLTHNHVLRVPRCRACGVPEGAVPSPWFDAP